MSTKNSIQLLILAALWGASFMFMRIAVPEFGAVVLIELRVLIAGLVLLPFWWLKESPKSKSDVLEKWPHLLAIGALNSAIPFVLFAYSMLYITGGMAATLNGTAPIWGAVVAWLWLKQRLSLSAVLGLVIGLSGVIVLVSDDLSLSFDGKTLGIIASASAPIMYGIAANYTTQKLAGLSPLSIATFTMFTSAIILLPFALYLAPDLMPSLKAWCSVFALAVLCTSFAYVLFFNLLAQVGTTKAITVTFLIPVFGALWGALFIDEQLTLTMISGMGIILIGTALVTGVVKLRAQASTH